MIKKRHINKDEDLQHILDACVDTASYYNDPELELSQPSNYMQSTTDSTVPPDDYSQVDQPEMDIPTEQSHDITQATELAEVESTPQPNPAKSFVIGDVVQVKTKKLILFF